MNMINFEEKTATKSGQKLHGQSGISERLSSLGMLNITACTEGFKGYLNNITACTEGFKGCLNNITPGTEGFKGSSIGLLLCRWILLLQLQGFSEY